MKFNFVKKSALSLLLSLAVLSFFSCQQVIFDNIRKEVKLENGMIAGDIPAIVKFKDYYFLSNGGIYYKHKSSSHYGSWIRLPSPAGHVIKLAADANYIYALVGIHAENEKEGKNQGVRRDLYYSENGYTWLLVKGFGANGSLTYLSNYPIYIHLFCTNTIDAANRSAYVVVNDGARRTTNYAYRLNGDSIINLPLGLVDASTTPVSNAAAASRSCVYYKGDVIFFSSLASTTNETALSPATVYYYGFGQWLRWGGEIKNIVGYSCEGTLMSLGVTADYLLVGTNAGIRHRPLTNRAPGPVSVDFKTNAASTLNSAYQILSLLVVNPELNETQTAIYASQVYSGTGSSNSAQFDHVGLWAYYPYRGNWNRE